jgi:hypothetical protein
MNLGAAAVSSLALAPLSRSVWYRAVNPHFLPTALSTAHTRSLFSRYSPGPLASRPFEILYLAENHLVALFEVRALFGSPLRPGGLVANPGGTWTIINATVQLGTIADLSNPSEQRKLATNVQELTGDWAGYHLRSSATSVRRPSGIAAPTQELGEAVFKHRGIEGFLGVSAKLPYHRILIVFPERLLPGSFIEFDNPKDPTFRPIRIP